MPVCQGCRTAAARESYRLPRSAGLHGQQGPTENTSCLFLSLWLVTARSSQLFLRCVAVACEAGDPPGRTQLDQRDWSHALIFSASSNSKQYGESSGSRCGRTMIMQIIAIATQPHRQTRCRLECALQEGLQCSLKRRHALTALGFGHPCANAMRIVSASFHT